MKSLYNRLATLVKNNKSGIVTFCGNPGVPETFFCMAYFHSLGYVFCQTESESSYFDVKSSNILNKALWGFSKLNGIHSPTEIDKLESSHLNTLYADLLWHMAHEMEIENHTYEYSDLWEIPCIINNYDEFENFTLGFAGDLESDAMGFFENSQSDTGFSVYGKDFRVVHDTSPQNESWTLYYVYPENFVDDHSGEEYIIQRLLRIITCDNWRSLYAASRAVIYNRLHSF